MGNNVGGRAQVCVCCCGGNSQGDASGDRFQFADLMAGRVLEVDADRHQQQAAKYRDKYFQIAFHANGHGFEILAAKGLLHFVYPKAGLLICHEESKVYCALFI